MKDWKKIADGNRLGISETDLDRIAPALDDLDTKFRPLAKTIPHDVEPAISFTLEPEGGE